MTAPFVTVLIVNYNGRRFLADCLSSLERQSYHRHRFEVLLIDNGSQDESAAFVRQEFPWVTVIELHKNLGFAGGNNAGLRHARGEWVALLNNDTVVDPRWLSELIKAARAPDIGGVNSRILFRDRPGIVNSTGLVLYRDGRGGDRDFQRPDGQGVREAAEVFGGSGASILLRRRMLDDVGPFDPQLFMYYEDLDLAWRARLRGWRFIYAPRSVVQHVHCGTAVDQSPFQIAHVERNRALVNVKNGPVWMAAFALIGLTIRQFRTVCRALFARRRYRINVGHMRAMIWACASAAVHLPLYLVKRYHVRTESRRRPDRDILRWLATSPKAA